MMNGRTAVNAILAPGGEAQPITTYFSALMYLKVDNTSLRERLMKEIMTELKRPERIRNTRKFPFTGDYTMGADPSRTAELVNSRCYTFPDWISLWRVDEAERKKVLIALETLVNNSVLNIPPEQGCEFVNSGMDLAAVYLRGKLRKCAARAEPLLPHAAGDPTVSEFMNNLIDTAGKLSQWINKSELPGIICASPAACMDNLNTFTARIEELEDVCESKVAELEAKHERAEKRKREDEGEIEQSMLDRFRGFFS